MKISISGINTYNSDSLNDIAGIAGFCYCINREDLCNATLDIQNEESRQKLDITEEEVGLMLKAFLENGFILSASE